MVVTCFIGRGHVHSECGKRKAPSLSPSLPSPAVMVDPMGEITAGARGRNRRMAGVEWLWYRPEHDVKKPSMSQSSLLPLTLQKYADFNDYGYFYACLCWTGQGSTSELTSWRSSWC